MAFRSSMRSVVAQTKSGWGFIVAVYAVLSLASVGLWVFDAGPTKAVLTIKGSALPALVRDPANPLGLAAVPPGGYPLQGAAPFIDLRSGPAAIAQRQAASRPAEAAQLGVIASQPQVQRYGNWSGDNPRRQVAHYLHRAASLAPGTVPEIATYWIVNGAARRRCHHFSDPPGRAAEYGRWIRSLASGIRYRRAVVFLEMDSLITTGCLSRTGLRVRMGELKDAAGVLGSLPRTVVYLDAGAADALTARRTASLLRRAGVAQVQGFFLNSTHFDWTSREIRYGRAVSARTGGKHFVVNTAENGRGPLMPRDRVHHGNEVLCNPPGRGLGPKPTFTPGYRLVDAFAWIAYPGKSGGKCRPGAPATGVFWPALALELVRDAGYSAAPPPPRAAAPRPRLDLPSGGRERRSGHRDPGGGSRRLHGLAR